MIFLKRIEAVGFKSFAEHTVLNYDFAMTGVVGPNGSGKSNITDAIMWALGEQSSKSLRGNSMEDIVFSGSADRGSQNMAEVTLVFDNSKRAFSSLDYNEVAITRKYFKNTKESEFFINGSKVRLKDVQNIALETGLTKSSLAIISQGSISNFVESSPEQRRRLFDEAAGVATYKKRKEEAIRKLLHTQDNLARVNDIINEIERKLPSLKRQSKKAQEYKEKFDELKEIEVSVLVQDIELYSKRSIELNDQKNEIKLKIDSQKMIVDEKNLELSKLNSENSSKDKESLKLNDDFRKVVEKISKLQVLKMNLEMNKQNSEINDKESVVKNLITKSKEIEIKLNTEKTKIEKLVEEKAQNENNLKSALSEKSMITNELNSILKILAKTENQIEELNQKKLSNEGLFEGVRNILDNKKVLPGIIGQVQELIHVDKDYEVSISSILTSGLQNIVVNNAENVKVAIKFLKDNRAGHATFLPLDILRANQIPNDIRFAVQNLNGFVGFANEVIKIEKKYQIILDYLVGTYILVEDYDSAIETAKMIKYKYNIVTLDGQRILPHGAIVGGSRKKRTSFINDNSKLEELESKKIDLEKKELELKEKASDVDSKINVLREVINEHNISTGSARQTLQQLNEEKYKIHDEYRIITGKELDGNDENYKSIDKQIIEVIEKISYNETEKEKVQQQINILNSLKEKSNSRQNELFTQIQEESKMLNALRENYSQINSDYSLIIERKATSIERLSKDYNLTFESALSLKQNIIDNEDEIKERINKLRSDIRLLGNVNLESIVEYETEQSRFDDLLTQSNDIKDSISNLNEAIKDMDSQMIIQFKQIIKDVNASLPETFARLFGGGTASIVYTNPDDVLDSGIDIKIAPPGKKISNLHLLSGGEKSLVALSVLFSILKVKPIPLVILDEVEAPLDVANVERFAKYIKTFTDNTQFMIVTHRIGTMENCDILFGVTMQQKGITKLVQIKLVEAKKLSNSN
ncbi:chromosome condensation and segregation SMC ATPase [Spiroplasma helicoides]|uniref:Chromosome partition protein Smc n=1 Tax=Spiroplasma helicoides TaxID=216938 RepID=A0A1B3SL91_9MOLU|nr:AAA family ATPase [Spiroplasma helicoides]AOG60711.1 chromosome condensation and segregation SMC ATPase [Spiroplasma helicoides]